MDNEYDGSQMKFFLGTTNIPLGGKTMKKQILKSALIALAGVGLMSGSVWALPNGGNSSSLQGVFNSIATDTLNDVSAESYINDGSDATWSIAGSGGAVATLIIELAGFAPNSIFGIYDQKSDGTYSYVQLFGGAADQYDQAQVSILANGTVDVVYKNYVNGQLVGGTIISDANAGFTGNSFGFYLDSSYYTNGGLWHSNTAMNSDGLDHMLAYQGIGEQIKIGQFAAGPWTTAEYILAFEDLQSSWVENGVTKYADWDYTDMVVMVESVQPIPEPATMLLFGTGLMGLAGFARRKKCA